MGIPFITTGYSNISYIYTIIEKSLKISIDKWSDTWYHTINERESTLKEIQKGA
jgi:hypothetical protein